MKLQFKNWMAILLMTSACVGFSACGDDEEESSDNRPKTGDTQTTSNANSNAKNIVLTPGVYFNSNFEGASYNMLHNELLFMASSGDSNGIPKKVREESGMTECGAIRVVNGNMCEVISVYASLVKPSGDNCLIVSQKTYLQTQVYYYVDLDDWVDDWAIHWDESSTAIGRYDPILYENGCFVGYYTNATKVYYKLVK